MYEQNSRGLKIVGQTVFEQNYIRRNVIGRNIFGRFQSDPIKRQKFLSIHLNNALWLPNVIGRTRDQSATNQRSNCLEVPNDQNWVERNVYNSVTHSLTKGRIGIIQGQEGVGQLALKCSMSAAFGQVNP